MMMEVMVIVMMTIIDDDNSLLFNDMTYNWHTARVSIKVPLSFTCHTLYTIELMQHFRIGKDATGTMQSSVRSL